MKLVIWSILRFSLIGILPSVSTDPSSYIQNFMAPLRILERIGKVAYKLLLPYSCQLHPIFHVSQLKRHIGPKAVPTPDLPLIDASGNIRVAPVEILERRLVPRNNEPVVQWLIQWSNLPVSEATWEDVAFIQKVFPSFHP